MVDSTDRNTDSTPTHLTSKRKLKITDAVVKATIAALGSVQEQFGNEISTYEFATK